MMTLEKGQSAFFFLQIVPCQLTQKGLKQMPPPARRRPRTRPPVQTIRPRPRRPRRPANPVVMRVVIITIGVALAVAAIMLFGLTIPTFGGSDGQDQENLPKVSTGDIVKCKRNNSPSINLNSPARVKTCDDAKKYAKAKLTEQYGTKTGGEQFGCLQKLWDHESDWSAWAINRKFADPELRAQGIPQMIPKYHGHPFALGEWQKQVDWGLGYIKGRYQTPCAAWEWWQNPKAPPFDQNWY